MFCSCKKKHIVNIFWYFGLHNWTTYLLSYSKISGAMGSKFTTLSQSLTPLPPVSSKWLTAHVRKDSVGSVVRTSRKIHRVDDCLMPSP